MSNYPNDVDVFSEKLNKSDTVYVIEEQVTVISGVYQAVLQHDNVIDSSVRVYTGSKLTGERIDNFILSIPADAKWKRIIKIFTAHPVVFISYETTGDQVEAEDINKLQDSVTATQTEVDRYKTANDIVVQNTVSRVTTLENVKADKMYVDSELLKKAEKVNTYTKTETDARIQAVVDVAPAALDTLNEIAAALNDDPNFATTMTNELSKKVDKVTGKQLSTEDYTTAEKTKLAGIEAGATADMTASEILTAIKTVDGAASGLDADLLDGQQGSFYQNRANHTGTQTAATISDFASTVLATLLNGLSTVTNMAISATDTVAVALGKLQAQITAHLNNTNNPHGVTKTQVGLGNVDNTADNMKNVLSASKLTTARTISLTGDATGSVTFDGSANASIAVAVTDDSHNHTIPTVTGLQAALDAKQSTASKNLANGYAGLDTNGKLASAQIPDEYVTATELGAAGYGDMMKSTYDADGDGVVDAAESVPWAGVTGKPSTFTPSTHTHSQITFTDTRSVNHAAFDYTGVSMHLKSNAADGLSDGGMYHGVMHITQWNDISGGRAHQLGFSDNGNVWYRDWTGSAWTPWKKLLSKNMGITWNDLKGV